MQRAVREFVRKVRPGDLALFYYSGHGMQVGRNNWMIPIDFHADFEDEVPDQALAAQRVLSDLEEAGASVRILILDACRDNPLPAAAKRSGKDGLLPMNGAEGTYLLFATAENQTASDNPRGVNGLFTSFLLEAMRRPGVSLDQAFKETRREVAAATNGKQRPWLATDIDRDIVLRPGAAVTVAPSSPSIDPATEAWALIRNSQFLADFDQFVAMFPDSGFAATAKLRASQLRRDGAPVIPVDAPSKALRMNAKDSQQYVWIPPGRFRMGCSPGDDNCEPDERPAHDVEIPEGFWLARTVVTVGAWKRYTIATGQAMPAEPKFSGESLNPGWRNDEQPVVNVSAVEAAGFCSWSGGRLPMEAEWEYAARAGAAGPLYASLDNIAWHSGNSDSSLHPVGQKQPNAWKLTDMLGSVWQWTADAYDEKSYSLAKPDPPNGEGFRTLRGGFWGSKPSMIRVSNRYGLWSGYRGTDVGLRCVIE